MPLETVKIGEQLYHIHQGDPRYGADEIGNPTYLGEDYFAEDIVVLPPRVDDKGNIYYEHNGIQVMEDMFIALCRVEIDSSKTPVDIQHIDGDDFNNEPSNLLFTYEEDQRNTWTF